METLDYIVLAVYFLVVIGIGLYCARRNKKQEDYFMGGSRFRKVDADVCRFWCGNRAARSD